MTPDTTIAHRCTRAVICCGTLVLWLCLSAAAALGQMPGWETLTLTRDLGLPRGTVCRITGAGDFTIVPERCTPARLVDQLLALRQTPPAASPQIAVPYTGPIQMPYGPTDEDRLNYEINLYEAKIAEKQRDLAAIRAHQAFLKDIDTTIAHCQKELAHD